MSTKSHGIWSFALPLSLVILAAAYYIRVPSVRAAVDPKAPWVKDVLGRFVREPEVQTVIVKQEQPAGSRAEALKPPTDDKQEIPAPPVVPPKPLDLKQIAADRSVWPKKVALVKPANFPAVFNGKVVGSLIAPAGAEATLVSIKDDKVGLEYQGGGTWLPADQTDLLARVHASK